MLGVPSHSSPRARNQRESIRKAPLQMRSGSVGGNSVFRGKRIRHEGSEDGHVGEQHIRALRLHESAVRHERPEFRQEGHG